MECLRFSHEIGGGVEQRLGIERVRVSLRDVADALQPRYFLLLPPAGRWRQVLLASILLFAGWMAYRNSFHGPFVFDDIPTIADNPTIRKLWPLSEALSPPSSRGLTVNGRPLVNLSLALNYAMSGLDPFGYHLFNFTAHILASLVLFGIVRRTAQNASLGEAVRNRPTEVAFVTALLWLLHPLQTGAVTYIVQRAETLVGLFYLLSLYSFIRSTDESDGRARWWTILSVAMCFAGMATKEVMVSAPVTIFLYDRTFVAGSFRSAWQKRWRYHGTMAGAWVLLAWLMIRSGGRGGTAGFGLGFGWIQYAITQIGAVAHYLRLSVWPSGQVFDYGGTVLIERLRDVWMEAIMLGCLGAGTVVALWKRPVVGFLGVWFFAILAPTSSVVPLADTMFEHRMYLPLAAVIAVVVGLIFFWLKRRPVAAFCLCAGLAVALGAATYSRNHIYRSELALWTDTVEKRPQNVRAHYTLGSVLAADGRIEEAVVQFEEALRLKPDSVEAHSNFGNALVRMDRLNDARRHYEAALRIRPASAETHNNLGSLLARQGLTLDARDHFENALRHRPDFADAHNNLGNLSMRLRRIDDAISHYRQALASKPDFFDAHLNLANALGESGRANEAFAHYRAALELRPDSSEAHYNLGVTLALAGRSQEALQEFEETLRLQPNHPRARTNLSVLRQELR